MATFKEVTLPEKGLSALTVSMVVGTLLLFAVAYFNASPADARTEIDRARQAAGVKELSWVPAMRLGRATVISTDCAGDIRADLAGLSHITTSPDYVKGTVHKKDNGVECQVIVKLYPRLEV